MKLQNIHYRPTIAEIDLSALRHNINEIKKKLLPDMSLLPVIKANAYGHGAVMFARVLEGMGIKSVAVATVEEGIELRNAGVRCEIVVLGGILSKTLAPYAEYRLRPVIHNMDDLQNALDFFKQSSREHSVHLKIDTGMGRLGFLPSDIEAVADKLKYVTDMKVGSIMTHLAKADDDDDATKKQIELFDSIKKALESRGLSIPVAHVANSAALIDQQFDSTTMARPGIMLYGAYPNQRHKEKISLKPVMKFKTAVLTIKRFPIGSPLGYGGTFVTNRETVVAILPVGYADGYRRDLSNKASVLIQEKRVPVLGRISMDLTLVDVTDVPEAKVGDEVVLIGSQGSESISAEDLAGLSGTISYEIFCGISSRVPRVYVGM